MRYDWYAKAIIDKIKEGGGMSPPPPNPSPANKFFSIVCPKCGPKSGWTYKELGVDSLGMTFTGAHKFRCYCGKVFKARI